jgi:hypothetical protein
MNLRGTVLRENSVMPVFEKAVEGTIKLGIKKSESCRLT